MVKEARGKLARGPHRGAPGLHELDDAGHDGEQDDQVDHLVEMGLHDGQVAHQISKADQAPDPQDAAAHGIAHELGVGHLADARHERRERAHDGHEAGYDDGLAAVLLVEGVGFLQVLLVEQLAVLAPEHGWTDRAAYPVVGVVAHDGGGGQKPHGEAQVQAAGAAERPDDEEQGIARQKRRHHEPGLAENHQEQHHVRPGAVVGHKHLEGFLDVAEHPDELAQDFH